MEIVQDVKKHWPWVVGGIVGLLIIVKVSKSKSAAPSSNQYVPYSTTGYATPTAVSPATYSVGSGVSANDVALAGINAQSAYRQAQLQSSYGVAMATLDSSTQLAAQKNQTQFLAAQGTVAQQVGAAAGALIASLQAPTITAINSGAVADSIALQQASQVVQTGIAADKSMTAIAAQGAQYTTSALTSSDAATVAAYQAAQNTYTSTTNTAAQVAGQVQIAQSADNAKVAMAPYSAQAAVANAQATEAVGVAQANASAARASGASGGSSSGGGIMGTGVSGSDLGAIASIAAMFL